MTLNEPLPPFVRLRIVSPAMTKRSLRLAVLFAVPAAAMALAWPTPAVADEPLVVTAKLVEIPGKLPSDDLYDYAFVMRYEAVGGPMAGKSLLVAHYKPRQPRNKIKDKMKDKVGGKLRSFVVGDTHKLKLTTDLKKIWAGALVDEFAATDRKSVRYFCLEADPG